MTSDGYTVKEILDEIVIPKLNQVAEDVAELKEKTATREQLNGEFRKAQEDINELKGYKNRITGALSLLMALVTTIGVKFWVF